MRVSILILYWLLLIATTGKAQTPLIDSLRKAIGLARNDSDKIIRTAHYAMDLAKADYPLACKLMDTLKTEARKKNYQRTYIRVTKTYGGIFYEKGDYLNSLLQYKEAEKYEIAIPDTGTNVRSRAGLFNDIGASYSLMNDLESAQKYYAKSIVLMEKTKDASALLMVYFNMAFVFIDMQEWEKADQYLRKSIQVAGEDRKDANLLATLSRSAVLNFKLKRITTGEKLLQRCNALLPLVKIDLDRIYYFNANAEYAFAKGNMEAALSNHRMAYYYSLLWNDPYYIADEAFDIARVYIQLNKTDSAEHYFRMAFDTAKVYNYIPKIRFILNEWATYYSNAKNYKKAYELRTGLLNLTDSLVTLQNHNRIFLFDAEYESIRKENQINQLESDKKLQQLSIKQTTTLNYILIGSAVTLLAIFLLSYRNYRQRQKLQQQRISELETEKQLMATEAVLKGEEQERSRLARDLHDGLGGMLSGIKYSMNSMKGNLVMTPDNQQAFERSMDMLDSSIKEMRRVAHNMMPEALVKFGLDTALKDFCNDINQSGALRVSYQSIGLENVTIDQTTSITIFRIVQELLNNTIKHAAAALAIVQLSKTDGRLSVTVEDDGKGFDTSVLHGTRGIGWTNIQSRVDFLKGKLDIDSMPGEGTSVHIEIVSL